LNRIDDIVTFDALSIADIEPIVELQLADVRERLQDRRVTLDVTPAAMETSQSTATTPCSARAPSSA
jgi:ATP-dependent Clp protease ATP-binding subunit ClpB